MMQQPTAATALRGIGPKTFISYSFRDRDLAEKLHSYLLCEGFQVRKEDETSLVGRRLAEELPRRIADKECFIPILTEVSSNSQWVQEEFRYAEEYAKTNKLRIAPVMLSSAGPPQWLGDFAYVDAARDGLSPAILEAIKAVSLSAVRLLEVNDHDPLKLLQADADKLFQSASMGHRVIFDSTGYWLRVVDSLIAWAGKGAPGEEARAQQFVQQELEQRRTIEWMFSIIDHVTDSLSVEVAGRNSRGIVEEQHLGLVLQLFYRIVFAKFLFEELRMALPRGIVVIGDSAREELNLLEEIAQEGTSGAQGFGSFMERSKQNKAIGWAFNMVFARTDLTDYAPRSRPLVSLSLTLARHKRASVQGTVPQIELQIPKLVVPYLLGTEALPDPKVKEWAWTLFALPQVATWAMEVGGARQGENAPNVVQAIKSGVGWTVQDYERIAVIG